MKRSQLIFYKSDIWIIIICSLCLQMSDLKVANIKISEVILLLMAPLYFMQVFKSRIVLSFFLFFILFFLKTAVFNVFTTFYINDELPLLKHPYLISLSRLIEMMACLSFCLFVLNAFKQAKDPFGLLKKVLFVQIFVFGLFYIAVYVLFKVHIFSTTEYETLIVYDASSTGDAVYRLRGFYVEGGPLGLFYAFLFVVCIAFYRKLKLTPAYIIICLIIIILASSKAGYMLVILTGVFFLFSRVTSYIKTYALKVAFYTLIICSFIISSYVVLQIYISTFNDVEERSAEFSPKEIDPNFMMGRISASVIYPNMLRDNYLKGIGWGNYPLLRNKLEYRDFMPEIPVGMWDGTGFGGIADTLIEAGLPLFFLYLLIYYQIIKQIKKYVDSSNYIVLAFIGPLLLGVAIYFLYMWFLLGVILFCIQSPSGKKNELLIIKNS